MGRFAIIRLLGVMPQLLLVSMLAFLIMKMAPGDPVASLAGGSPEFVSAFDHARISRNLGLDAPLHEQYGLWLGRMFRGDWGVALKDGRPVFDLVMYGLKNTLALVSIVWIVTIVGALLLGWLAGSRPDSRWDYAISALATASSAVPPFWLGLLLILVFSVWLQWFPSSGSMPIGEPESLGLRLRHLALPVATVALTHIGPYVRLVRGSVRDALSSSFILAARARGLSRRTIAIRYLLPNALTPFITWAGFSLPLLISGTFVIEWLFAWPGLGRQFLQAALAREYPILMGSVVVVCALVILGNVVADAAVAAIDPKLRRKHAGH